MWKGSIQFKNRTYPISFQDNGRTMSTAIVWAYIPEGFVIAADGRRMDGAKGYRDNIQKIFSVRAGKLRLVYAWSGATFFETTDKTAVIDMKEITDIILRSIDTSSVVVLSDFLRLFSNALYTILLSPIGAVLKTVEEKQMPQVLLLGYFQGEPYTAEIFTRRKNSTILRPEIKCRPMTNRIDVFSGSKRVSEEFDRTPRSEPSSLHEARFLIQEYITRCVNYQNVDSECAQIGGHIHTGKLTPKGFSWLDCPLRG
jgi:hypothetical protein